MTTTTPAPTGPGTATTPASRPARSDGPVVAGAATVAVGAGGVVCGLVALRHGIGPVRIGWLLPLSGVTLAARATGGFFEVLAGAVAVAVGIFAVGYFRHARTGIVPLGVLPVFAATVCAVPLAGSVTTFLAAWELMALTSLVAVLSDHRRPEVRRAGRWYASMTQFGFAAVLLGLVVLVAAGGGDSFAALGAGADRLDPATRDVVFAATFTGFGAKAGLAPLHVWLPRAHPEAPSPVSAYMSAAMVAMGVYGIIRVDIGILGSGPRWWALSLLGAGGLSALYGVLQASVAVDLKRLLAYSTTENMGLVVTALGAAMLLEDYGQRSAALVAVAAALVLVAAHASFKTLTFLGAGSVLAATGERDLDHLGGLVGPMPATSAAFAFGALGASGLPLGAGFAGEWLLLQALIHTRPAGGVLLASVMPVAVAVVALTTGLGMLAMVKAFGVGFLARPRSAAAAGARESAPSMLAGMAVAAAACGIFALDPAAAAGPVRRVLAALPWSHGATGAHLGAILRLPGAGGSVSPAGLALATTVATVAVTVATARAGARRRPAARRAPLWACGAGEPTARMEYTATSFAEPLQRVFDDVLDPDTDIEVTHVAESTYLVERVRYRSAIGDVIEDRLYRPLLAAVDAWAGLVRRAHPGRIHVALLTGALGLVVVVVVGR